MKPLNEVSRDAQAKAESLADSARETAAAARARIQEGYGRARDKSGELAARGRAQAENLARRSSETYAKGKQKAGKANQRLKKIATEQPLILLAGATAIGALLGSMLPRRRGD